MRCKRCGARIRRGGEFCGTCGAPVRWEKHARSPKISVLIALLVIIFLVIFAVFVYPSFIANKSDDNRIDPYVFNESVIGEVDAATSSDCPATAGVVTDLDDRGFKDYWLTSAYDMDGSMREDEELDQSSSERHPLYNAIYVTPEGRVWVIYVCNGSYMANPFFMYDQAAVPCLLIEDEYVTSYSSNDNVFIRSIPDETELIVKKVQRIDSATLDNLDEEGVNSL